MLESIRNDLVYLLNILDYIEKSFIYTSGTTDAESFYSINEQLNYNAVLGLLMQIGENASKTSNELRDKYDNVDWTAIKAFRNRIAHDYSGLNLFMVYDIVRIHLPRLKVELIDVINAELKAEHFEIEELHAAAVSPMYSHIDFRSFTGFQAV